MRNLKRVLSLALACVMVIGMMVMTTGAAKYDDADAIDYVEAVDVLSAIGILEGDGTNFNPDDILTREQAAKIISCMLLGINNAEKLGNNTQIFNDVAAGRWSAGYIAYCSNLGIISGYAGNFNPEDQLTGVAFAKMLLTALGYNAEIEGYVNNPTGWATEIGVDALDAGIDVDGMNLAAPVSREVAAQMALNAIKAPLVKYENTGSSISVNGAEIVFGASKAEYVTTELANTQTISGRRLTNTNYYTIEFGEKYMPALKLSTDETDAFGRPAHTWTYATEEVGTYIDSELLIATYTDSMKGSDLFKLLGRTAVTTYDIDIYVDGADVTDTYAGEINKDNEKFFSPSGTGVRTEVFMNTATEEVTIAVINTYLAIATADYNDKTEKATFDVYGVDKDTNGKFIKAKTAGDDSVSGVKVGGPSVKNIKKDDVVLVTVSGKGVITVEAAPVVPDVTISSFSLGRSVVADGETYKYAAAAEYDYEVLDQYSDHNMKDTTYNLFLDPYGNMIGLEIVVVPSNYLFVTGINAPAADKLANSNYEVRAIFLDGTTEVITAKDAPKQTALTDAGATSQHNTWYTYTVDAKGVYSLTPVATTIDTTKGVRVAQSSDDNTPEFTIDAKHVSLSGGTGYTKVYGNNDTVYLTTKLGALSTGVATADVIITGVSGVTTGVENANIDVYTDAEMKTAINGKDTVTYTYVPKVAHTLYKSTGYIIASVVVGEDSTASKNLVYVNSQGPNMESYANNKWTWTREVILNGEKTTLTEVGASLAQIDSTSMVQGNWYVVSYNADGQVVGSQLASTAFGSDCAGATDYVSDYDAANSIGKVVGTLGMDTVLYQETLTNTSKLIGQTLYLDAAGTHGFRVHEDAKVVMIQTNKNVTTTTYEEGINAVEAALDNLNTDKSGNVNFTMNALIEDGRAVVIIINDNNTDGYSNTSKIASDEDQLVGFVPTTGVLSVYVEDSSAMELTAGDIETIGAYLESLGYTDVSYDGSTSKWDYTKGYATYTGVTITPTQVYKVTVTGGTVTKNGLTVTVAGADTAYYTSGSSITVKYGVTGTANAAGNVAVFSSKDPDGTAAGTVGTPANGSTKADGTGSADTTGLDTHTAGTIVSKAAGTVDAAGTVIVTSAAKDITITVAAGT